MARDGAGDRPVGGRRLPARCRLEGTDPARGLRREQTRGERAGGPCRPCACGLPRVTLVLCASRRQANCLWHHRKRQRYFLGRCLADFKRRNRTWVLLTDVDEYVALNRVHRPEDGDGDPDPELPLDAAPPGVPTLSDWKKTETHRVDPKTGQVFIEGERCLVYREHS